MKPIQMLGEFIPHPHPVASTPAEALANLKAGAETRQRQQEGKSDFGADDALDMVNLATALVQGGHIKLAA